MLTNTNSVAQGASAAGAASDTVAASASATQQMFTKLLVAQIQNQDPLSPTDPSQFVSQLAQLSQTEAVQTLTQSGSTNTSMLQNLQQLALGAQVGSSVSVATTSVQVGNQPLSGTLQLTAASSATTLTLTGVDGQAHALTLPASGPGAQAFTLDPSALGLPPGAYTVQAQASDNSNPTVEVAGRLDSVRMSASGGVLLQVDSVGAVAPSAITAFNGKPSGT